MPSGRSALATPVRATRSAITSTSAPPSALAGTSTRWPGPATIRTRCGTTRPTNAMIPANATPAATVQGDQHDGGQPEPLDVDAEVARGALAEREQVQPPRERERASHADDRERARRSRRRARWPR